MNTDVTLKACPVITRERNGTTEILAFKHPEAGYQIVKGTIEHGEDPATAALRELEEESGIADAQILQFVEEVHFEDEQQIWHIFLCQTGDLPEKWSYETLEGDGNLYEFKFFWHPITAEMDADWYYTFQHIVNLIRGTLTKT